MDSHPTRSTWNVLVLEMNHTGDENGDYITARFTSKELAIEYARRIVWGSVENLRKQGITTEELRKTWYCLGDDAIVPGTNYSGSSELDRFINNIASPEAIDLSILDKLALPTKVTNTAPTLVPSITVASTKDNITPTRNKFNHQPPLQPPDNPSSH